MRSIRSVPLLTSASILVLLLSSVIPSVSAWSNGGYSNDPNNPDYGTHDWIADKALAIQTRDVSFLSSTYHNRYLLGTEAPDNPDYIGDSTYHHVYYYSSGDLQDDRSATRASQMYQTALDYLSTGDSYNAAFYVGAMTHYISDVGVFGHTMGAATDWGTEIHHSDYENHIESLVGTLPQPTGISLGDSDASTAALTLARHTTFGSGTIKSNVWMDMNYNWADSTFTASAMASLTDSVTSTAAAINHLMIASGSSTPTPPPPPSPPSTLQVPGVPISLTASVENSHIVLTWQAPQSNGGTAISSYKIFRGTDESTQVLVANTTGSASRWVDESAEKGSTYYYRIAAGNSVGLSNMSEGTYATLPKDSHISMLPIVVSVFSIVLAATGALLWQRSRRR